MRDKFFRFWTRQLLRKTKPCLVGVSQAVADYTATKLGFDPSDFHVIYNGVDLKEFDFSVACLLTDRALNNPPVIGLSAHFRPEKGHRDLVDACVSLRERGIIIRLKLAGDGPCLSQLKEYVQQLGLANQVEFLGHISAVRDFLSTLDVFVLPSTAYEGLPLCVLEAMAMALPVVATRVAGTPEAIQNKKTGLLVDPNCSDQLAFAIETLLMDTALRITLAKQGWSSVQQNFSFQTIAQQTTKLYQTL